MFLKLHRCHVLNNRSKYKEPALEEGFSEIVRVNFVPHFTTKEEKRLYETYLQEK